MSTPDLCYTYIYYDPSRNNEPIYVGQGINNRVWVHFSRKGMHPLTQRLNFMKNRGITPNVGIYAGFDKEFACLLEIELISKFGRKDLGEGSLLNLTNGGENGTPGAKFIFTQDHKDNLSKACIGKIKSVTHRENISLATKGKPNGRKGVFTHSDETKLKMSKPKSEQGRQNIAKGAKKRKPVTEEARKNRALSRVGIEYPIVQCPHCGKEGGSSGMGRWHFNRCKYKDN